jgi:acetyl esterase
MPIHPKLQEFLREVKGSSHKSFSQMSIQEMRQATKNFKVFQGDSEDIHQVIKKSIKQKDHEYQMRLYYPSSKKGLPLILFFHSGGFVKGDVEFSEPFCRRIANGAQAIVASVNYRLAPEHRFPSALEDAYSALCWVYEHAVEQINIKLQ